MQQILTEIANMKIKNINLLALITNTSAEVVFYASVGDSYGQSNDLAEKGILDIASLDRFYKIVADTVRQSEDFDSNMLNIVKITPDLTINVSHAPRNSRVYPLKKAWEASLES